ncbi:MULTISPECIES: response regulator [Pseudomonas]|uniref:Response regulator n=1 Tax=Pseudomonas asiatica TaxID=2219225 RepID=A0ABU5KUK0_9PSED|nr:MULTISPECIES: response regulator [Pseudomonas]UQB79285.1 response regulator [Pseudomonas shirazica]GLO31424.1 response regulator [Pseudomonas putida]KIC81846.1 response regulator [Pseudomonas sp. C5pp]MDZ5737610.1 response regulator [Pseudomonas asiatica]MDZ5745742.1 response regulator [Pseudomonas asiatica]
MHLLVVEDDDIVRMLMVEVLDELGYTVIEADSAGAALRIIEDPGQELALMLTDVGLPDMGGEELAGKARDLRPLLPVLFASGYAENVNVPEGMHLIGKPFSIDQLRDKVQAILGNP